MTRGDKHPRLDPSEPPLIVSLKTLARMLDTGRSSARRWLRQAGVQPIAMNDGPKSAIRYRWPEVKAWIESRQHVE